MKNMIQPCITPCHYTNDVVVAVEITNGNHTWTRNLVGFSDDRVTRKALKSSLSIDLLNTIAEANWLNHYDEEDDHYMTDMESRLGIESFGKWKSNSFELDEAEISFDGLNWRLSNDEGQEIVLDDWSKDRPFLRWVDNPIEY